MRAGAEIEQMRAVRIRRCEKSAIGAEVKGRKTHGGGQWDLQSPKNGAMIQLPDAQALALARVADVLIITTELEPKTSTRDEQRFAGASVPKSRAAIPCCGHQQISPRIEIEPNHNFHVALQHYGICNSGIPQPHVRAGPTRRSQAATIGVPRKAH